MQPDFTCPLCLKKLPKLHRTRHFHTHTGERPHFCKECGKSFARLDKLKRHMKIHQPDPVGHKCDVCGKEFQRRDKLRRHLVSHSSARPYKCLLCRVDFKYKESLFIHQNSLRHHDINVLEGENLQPQGEQLLQKDFSSEMFEEQKSAVAMFNTDSKYSLMGIVCTEEVQVGGIDSEIEAEQEASQSDSRYYIKAGFSADLSSGKTEVSSNKTDIGKNEAAKKMKTEDVRVETEIGGIDWDTRFSGQAKVVGDKTKRKLSRDKVGQIGLNTSYSCPFSPFCLFTLTR